MQTYKGSLTLAIAATFTSVDIDPAERAGYVNELVGMELIVDVAATAGTTMMGASVKVPVRSTFNETEQFDPDIIARGLPARGIWTRSVEAEPASHAIYSILDHDAFFQNSLRIVFATRDGAGAANAETLHYRLFVEERKLTDSIRNTINQRSYS